MFHALLELALSLIVQFGVRTIRTAAENSISSFNLFPVRRGGCTSIFGRRFASSDSERLCDFGRLGEHHTGFAADSDELESLLNPALGSGGVNHMNASRHVVFLPHIEQVLQRLDKFRRV